MRELKNNLTLFEVEDENDLEVEEVIPEKIRLPKKKDIKNESLFSRLFQYYWYIQKYKTGFSALTDLNKLVDYYDLSEYLSVEKLR